MKKIIALCLVAMIAAFTPPAQAQNKSYLVSKTWSASTGFHFRTDSIIGKGITAIQLFDSVQNKWLGLNSATVVDSLVADTISNAKDAAFFQTLIYHQKTSGNTLGLIDKTWYYVWNATGRLYYKARYNKMLIYYKGS